MTAVVLSRRLAQDLAQYGGSTFPRHFAAEFQLWKEGGIGAGDTFGKNTPFSKPKAVVECDLWKVHLETSAVTPRWNRMLDEEGITDPQAYTSDRLLVYGQLGDFAYRPYLLLSILDPAHSLMQDPARVLTLAEAYELERFAFSRWSPGDDSWTVVGMS